jgi:hypothetical protein
MPGDGFVTTGQWKNARRLTLGRGQHGPTARSDKTVPPDHYEVFGPMQPANLVVMPIIPPSGLAVGRTWMCVSPTSSTYAS